MYTFCAWKKKIMLSISNMSWVNESKSHSPHVTLDTNKTAFNYRSHVSHCTWTGLFKTICLPYLAHVTHAADVLRILWTQGSLDP